MIIDFALKKKAKKNCYEYHCDLCRCPISAYKPLKNYPYNDGCEIYYDFLYLLDREQQTALELLFIFRSELCPSYPKISNPFALFKELTLIQEDLGELPEGFLEENFPCEKI
jgi:hypothetical protein